MNARPRHSRTAALLLAALLALAPTALAAQQRRRSAPRKPAPAAPAPAAAAPANEAQRQQDEIERPFDTTIAADSYVVYVELRNIGQLAGTREVRNALDAFRLVGGAPQGVTDLIDFLTANEEAFASVRVVTAAMPTRAGLPDGVTAFQFPTPDAARLYEPKLRALAENLGGVFGPPAPAADATPPATRGRGNARRARAPKKTSPVVLKRAGSWVYAALTPFTFKSLKGEGASALADNARLQSFRSRLANESVFVYYETRLWRRGWELQQEQALKRHEEMTRAAATATATTQGLPTVPTIQADPVLMPEERPVASSEQSSPPPVVALGQTVVTETLTVEAMPTDEPEAEPATAEETPEPTEEEAARMQADKAVEVAAPPKNDEERAARAMMTTLIGGIFGGITREPEALAVGLALEGDMVVARLLVSREPNAPNNIIPFFPNVVAGPAVTPETLSVAPADSEIFAATSFDWPRIYESLVETMNRPPPSRGMALGAVVDGEPRGAETSDAVMRPDSIERGIEAMEKLFGFSLKQDLLPALGNEVALSAPADYFEGRPRVSVEPTAGRDGEKPAWAGPVVIVALNNPDAVRRATPLVLAALGLPVAAPAAAPERRKGFDIQPAGAAAYVFINNFLVIGESAPAVRHVVDSYASNQTLAASTRFRDSVSWQEHQRLALVYVSDALLAKYNESMKQLAEGSTDPVVLAALAQLDTPLAPVSYSATEDGDALRHELRVPVALGRIFAASTVIQIKEGPVITNEAMGAYALRRLHIAQEDFKDGKGKGRYGSIEELIEAKNLEKDFTITEAYNVELRASGDKYTATATPKDYGQTGRRSFFIDETGVLRGANHKGEPATASDPLVDR